MTRVPDKAGCGSQGISSAFSAQGSDKVLGLYPESAKALQLLVGIGVYNSAGVTGKRIDEKKDVTRNVQSLLQTQISIYG